MKVIDLLNKIANREEVPENIKWRDSIWEYRSTQQDYYHKELALFEQMQNIRTREFITDEVEIIEEDKDIEKLTYENTFKDKPDREALDILACKINELIKEVNKLKNN